MIEVHEMVVDRGGSSIGSGVVKVLLKFIQ